MDPRGNMRKILINLERNNNRLDKLKNLRSYEEKEGMRKKGMFFFFKFRNGNLSVKVPCLEKHAFQWCQS